MPGKKIKYKIALVTCYFGEAPWYLKFFLKSCEYNPRVDFFIIGDLAISNVFLPENVFLINMSLEEFGIQASQKLGLAVNVTRPYKLCDLKPAYGVIFGDLLDGYDFWGHGDIDVIFGDIRGFITNKILARFDVICVREEYVTGFFSLFRNNHQINHLFEQSKDYEEVFTNPKHYCFDECNFAWTPLMAGVSIFDIRTPIDSMTHVVKRLDAEGSIKAHFNFMVIEGLCGDMEWNRGNLYYANKIEAILYHLVKFKRQDDLVVPEWADVPDVFYIERNYFLNKSVYSK